MTYRLEAWWNVVHWAAVDAELAAATNRKEGEVNLSSWLHGFFGSRKPQDDEALQEEYGRRDLGEEELDREGVPGQDTAGADVADGVLDEFKAPPDPNP